MEITFGPQCALGEFCVFLDVWPFGRLTKQVFPPKYVDSQFFDVTHPFTYLHHFIVRSLDFSYDKK